MATQGAWARRDVVSFVQDHPTIIELVRCQSPAGIARRAPSFTSGRDGNKVRTGLFRGMPCEIWQRASHETQHSGSVGELILAWDVEEHCRNGTAARYVTHLTDSDEGGIQICGPMLVADLSKKIDVLPPNWVAASSAQSGTAPLVNASQSSGAQGSKDQGDDGPAHGETDELDAWHRALLRSEFDIAGNKLKLERQSQQPLCGVSAWRDDARTWRVRLNESNALRKLFSEHVGNFTFLRDLDADLSHPPQEVRVRRLPFYGKGAYQFEVIDRRGLRSRLAKLLYKETQAENGEVQVNLTALPPDQGSSPIHDFNRACGANLRTHLQDRDTAAAYLDFFCRSIYTDDRQTFFDLIADGRRDLLDIIRPPTDADSAMDRTLRKYAEKGCLGIWPLTATPISAMGAADARHDSNGLSISGAPPTDRPTSGSADQTLTSAPETSTVSPPERSFQHFFSALMLYGRTPYLCAFRVEMRTGGVVEVEMLEDHELGESDGADTSGAVLPVLPQIFDVDSHFTLQLRAAATGAMTYSSTAHISSRHPKPRLRPLPQPAEPCSGDEFSAWLKGKDQRLPRGMCDGNLQVRDAVTLRGHQQFTESRAALRVHFTGRVDLREIRINGSLDLSYCIFDEALLLQDAEIEGSLLLEGCTFFGGANLRGIIVKGNVRLDSTLFAPPRVGTGRVGLELSGATIDGDLDLRAAAEYGDGGRDPQASGGVRIRGARVGGRLQLGSDRHAGSRARCRIGQIDASTSRFGGIELRGGIGTRTTPLSLLLGNATIEGNVNCGPLEPGQKWSTDLELQAFDELEEEDISSRSIPQLSALDLRCAEVQGNLLLVASTFGVIDLENARIHGHVMLRGCLSRPGRSDGGRSHEWLLCADHINARGLQITGWFSGQGLSIKHDLELIEATIKGVIGLGMANDDRSRYLPANATEEKMAESLRSFIGGNIEASALHCESHVMLQGIAVGGIVRMLNADVGALNLRPALACPTGPDIVPSRVGGLYISNSTIHGNLWMDYLQVWGIRKHGTAGNRGVVINQTEIHGSLSLWSLGTFRDVNAGQGRRYENDPRPWDFAAAVHGDLRLLKTTIHGDCLLSFTKTSGKIDLGDSTIHGDLMLASRLRHEETLEGKNPIHDAMRREDTPKNDPRTARHFRACCHEFHARMLTVNSDAIIDGLDVDDSAMAVDLAHSTVRGDTVLWHHYDGLESSIQASPVDASFSELNRLVFSDRPDVERQEGHLKLSNSRIGVLELAKSEAPSSTWTVKLEGAQVSEWKVNDQGGKPDVERIEQLLQASPASVWHACETHLREHGHDAEADAIYRRHRECERKKIGSGDPRHQLLALLVVMSAVVAVSTFLTALVRLPMGLEVTPAWGWGCLALAFGAASAVLYKSCDQKGEHVKLKPIGAFALFTCVGLFCIACLHWLVEGSYRSQGAVAPPVIIGVLIVLLVALLRVRRYGEWLYGFALGYGTQVQQVVALWVTLVLASLPVYVAPENVEPSNASLTVTDLARRPPPMTADWTLGHTLAMVVRNHAPIMSFDALDDWRLKDGTPVIICWPSGTALPRMACIEGAEQRYSLRWLSPGAYGATMQTINWVLWPVFLTFMALKLWRRRARE